MARVALRTLANRRRVVIVANLLCSLLPAFERPLAHFLGQPVPETVADVIEDDRPRFVRSHAEHAADLLQVHPERLRRPEQDRGSHDGDVEAFGNDLAGREDLKRAIR